ncbi:MAG TPA: ABC transporter permease subunit [archaeon]|nr:ABC transporter permease subunit [archaeon]
MITVVIKKEIQENLYSYKFMVITLLSVVLVLASFFVMHRDYAGRVEEYRLLKAEARGETAGTPPAPLSVFARGLDQTLSQQYRLLYGGDIIPGGNKESYNELFLMFPTPDPLYVVKVILAFCTILFSFNAVTGEKEAGTLRLSLSNGIRRADFLVGKWIGGFSCFILPFLVSLLLALFLLSFSPSIDLDFASWIRIGFFSLSSITYLAFFFSLGLLVSCLTQRASTALAVSLFLWVLLVFVAPNTGGILAAQLEPSPSLQQLDVKRTQIVFSGIVGTFEEANKERPEEDKMSLTVDMTKEKLAVDYANSLARQADMTRVLVGWSPPAAYTFLATDLAGTGLVEEKRFKQAVMQYSSLLLTLPRLQGGQGLRDPAPPFNYERTPLRDVLVSGGLVNLVVLLLESLLVFAGAALAFLRYDLR